MALLATEGDENLAPPSALPIHPPLLWYLKKEAG
jgi:hypothetical protein